MTATEFERVQAYIQFAIWGIISLPMVCYICYQLRENWDEEWLKRRRRSLIVIIFVLFSYQALVECPFSGITRFDISPWLDNIITTVTYTLRFWLISFMVLRIYLLHYDHQYNRYINNNKWKLMINPTDLPKQQSWWLANRHHKYGDEKWLIFHILVPCTAIFSIIFIVVRWSMLFYLDAFDDFYHPFYYAWDGGMTVLWATINIGIGIYFWTKYPSFADMWLIRREIKLILLVGIISNVCLMITLLIQTSGAARIYQIGMMGVAMMTCIYLYVMVIYPQTANIRKAKAMRKQIEREEELKVTWKELVGTKEGYESFMNFLEKELSTEVWIIILIIFCIWLIRY